MQAFQSEQNVLMYQLHGDLAAKESIFSQQEKRITEVFLERDRIIALQADAIKKLETNISSLSEKAREQTQAYTHTLVQRDSLIEQQTQSLEKLKQDVLLMTENFNATAQLELSKQVEKMDVSVYTLHGMLLKYCSG
jgi:uncharacterized protein YigA (DUF484 family)